MTTLAHTQFGTLEGVDRGAVSAFLGVPYAAPPIHALRWHPPQAPLAWDGVRPAKTFGNAAAQNLMPGVHGVAEPPDEDCLYLNVWTPGVDDHKRPVMVWIHGGGFEIGAGSQAFYDGAKLASRGDVVVVTINYRMGPFGFLRLIDATGGDVPATGSEGMLDMVAALEWVAGSIAGFGGDVGNVTVFGESAGAIAIAGLLAMPRARGLFARAIVQSGPPYARAVKEANMLGETVVEKIGRDAGALFGASPDDLLKALPTVNDLRGVSFGDQEFDAVYAIHRPWFTADGEVVPTSVLDAIDAGSAAGVSLLAGTTRDEMRMIPPEASDETAHRILGAIFPRVDQADWPLQMECYRKARAADPTPLIFGPSNTTTAQLVASAIHTDLNIRVPTIRLLDAHRKHGSVYHYVFTWTSPLGDGTRGALHGGEIAFVFGTHNQSAEISRLYGAGPAADALSDAMQDAWVAFARTGDPSASAIGEWPPYDESRSTQLIGELCEVQADPWGKERAVWERYDDAVIMPANLI